MPTIAVVGMQWGDEGKGKIVDFLSANAKMVIRCQGGANAGHTVVTKGNKYVFHQVPSGILNPNTLCVIGQGAVVDPGKLGNELVQLHVDHGIDVDNRVLISPRAHVTLKYHFLLEEGREKGYRPLGTTKSGIGPTYADKINRIGIRMGDFSKSVIILKTKLSLSMSETNYLLKKFYGLESVDRDMQVRVVLDYASLLGPLVDENLDFKIRTAVMKDELVILEGAQGSLLDIDVGTYPYVTSSNTTSAGLCTGSGIPPTRLDKVIGVMKAYTTRVGEGPFPTELLGETGTHLQTRGNEFGSTTGRERCCGWLDICAIRESIWHNGISEIALTKMDVLDHLSVIPICIDYKSDGTPIYKEMAGWVNTNGITEYKKVAPNIMKFIDYLEEELQCPITMISTGQGREDLILRK